MHRLLTMVAAVLSQLLHLLHLRLFWWLLTPFLIVAAVFVTLHISHQYIFETGNFDRTHKAHLGRDRGYGERYEYVLTMLASLAMAGEYLRTRGRIYLGAAGVFAFMVIDNMARVHETAGHVIADAGILSSHQWGELLFFAAAGFVIAVAICMTLWKGNAEDNARGLAVLALILPVAMFGVFIDAASIGLNDDPFWLGVASLVEEAGEMIMICVLTAAATTLAMADRLRSARLSWARLPL